MKIKRNGPRKLVSKIVFPVSLKKMIFILEKMVFLLTEKLKVIQKFTQSNTHREN